MHRVRGDGQGEAMTLPNKASAFRSQKQSIYITSDALAFLTKESIRQDRSISWLIQKAVILSADKLRQFPGVG
jgi:uncharacterized small protein (TIGR04563 family)